MGWSTPSLSLPLLGLLLLALAPDEAAEEGVVVPGVCDDVLSDAGLSSFFLLPPPRLTGIAARDCICASNALARDTAAESTSRCCFFAAATSSAPSLLPSSSTSSSSLLDSSVSEEEGEAEEEEGDDSVVPEDTEDSNKEELSEVRRL